MNDVKILILVWAQISAASIFYFFGAPFGQVSVIAISNIGTVFITYLMLSKTKNKTKKIVVVSNKSLTHLEARINLLNSNGKLKGYEAQEGTGVMYYQRMVLIPEQGDKSNKGNIT